MYKNKNKFISNAVKTFLTNTLDRLVFSEVFTF